MLTFEKVLKVFEDYLAQDKACEVLTTSRGHLVVDWESCKNNWVTSRLCLTPEKLRDVLRCQRRCDFVVFRRTGNVEKRRVKVYSP